MSSCGAFRISINTYIIKWDSSLHIGVKQKKTQTNWRNKITYTRVLTFTCTLSDQRVPTNNSRRYICYEKCIKIKIQERLFLNRNAFKFPIKQYYR